MRENYPMKSPNLRHCQACSQNKGMSRASLLRTGPSPAGDRQVRAGNCGPRDIFSTKLQAGFVANQDFLGFWTVDTRQEGCSQRPGPAPQKRHTAHLRRCTLVHPENQVARMGKAISHSNHSCQTAGHLSCSDLGRAQNAGPTESVPLRTT